MAQKPSMPPKKKGQSHPLWSLICHQFWRHRWHVVSLMCSLIILMVMTNLKLQVLLKSQVSLQPPAWFQIRGLRGQKTPWPPRYVVFPHSLQRGHKSTYYSLCFQLESLSEIFPPDLDNSCHDYSEQHDEPSSIQENGSAASNSAEAAASGLAAASTSPVSYHPPTINNNSNASSDLEDGEIRSSSCGHSDKENDQQPPSLLRPQAADDLSPDEDVLDGVDTYDDFHIGGQLPRKYSTKFFHTFYKRLRTRKTRVKGVAGPPRRRRRPDSPWPSSSDPDQTGEPPAPPPPSPTSSQSSSCHQDSDMQQRSRRPHRSRVKKVRFQVSSSPSRSPSPIILRGRGRQQPEVTRFHRNSIADVFNSNNMPAVVPPPVQLPPILNRQPLDGFPPLPEFDDEDLRRERNRLDREMRQTLSLRPRNYLYTPQER